MLGRAGRISLVVFQFVWLNMVVPGHTRGAVTLPGTRQQASCCVHRTDKSKDQNPAKPGNDPCHCAICSFSARLTVPETIDLTPPALELLAIAEPVKIESIHTFSIPAPFDGRAPPAV